MRRTVVLLATMILTLLLASGVALAALANTADSGTVGANGRVWDILRAGDKVYLAGAFTQITDTDGTSFSRNNLAALDAATGRVTSWNPSATNPNNPTKSSVRSMALSSDGTRLFVGGAFTRVGGVPRSRLAAINPLTGAVDGGWNASADRPVHALVVSGNRLYLGGDFPTVAGQPREQLAAVDTATGALDPHWTPGAHRGDDNPKNYVWAMDLSDDGSRVYVGGFFNHISGQRTGKLAALDATTGAVVGAFDPQTVNNILAMDVAGGRIFVGTADPLEGIEAFDATTGQRYWSVAGGHPDPEAGDVQAIVAHGGKVYAGGHYAQMGGLVRKRLCEVDAVTGQIGPWAPEILGFQAGNLGVWALEVDPTLGRLYAGGDFLKVSGQDRQRFAQFSGL
jgi:PQQ-like domain